MGRTSLRAVNLSSAAGLVESSYDRWLTPSYHRWSFLGEAVEEGTRGEHGDRAFELEQMRVSGH